MQHAAAAELSEDEKAAEAQPELALLVVQPDDLAALQLLVAKCAGLRRLVEQALGSPWSLGAHYQSTPHPNPHTYNTRSRATTSHLHQF